MLTAELVRRLFEYDPDTGVVTRKISLRGKGRVGDVVGSGANGSRLNVVVFYKTYLLHRVIWLWMTGEWPDLDIDHRDTDQSNNRWANLRKATTAQNCQNRNVSKRSITGFKGVSKATGRNLAKPFMANIHVDGAHLFLGWFDTAEAANAAYGIAAKQFWGEFARS